MIIPGILRILSISVVPRTSVPRTSQLTEPAPGASGGAEPLRGGASPGGALWRRSLPSGAERSEGPECSPSGPPHGPPRGGARNYEVLGFV